MNPLPLMVPSQAIAQSNFGPLFAAVEMPPPPHQPSQWVIDLLSSSIYKSRRKLAGRAVPEDDVLAKVLLAIDNSGGKITVNALSRMIGYSVAHVQSILLIIQRILNIDSYIVVTLDPLDTVKLDRNLLYQQFSLKSRF